VHTVEESARSSGAPQVTSKRCTGMLAERTGTAVVFNSASAAISSLRSQRKRPSAGTAGPDAKRNLRRENSEPDAYANESINRLIVRFKSLSSRRRASIL
jgi:hypothetical protein